jgi:hypothetical protein
LTENFAISKKLHDQEIEEYKAQLKIAKNTIADLGLKFMLFVASPAIQPCHTLVIKIKTVFDN